MDTATRNQILNEAVCIRLHNNSLVWIHISLPSYSRLVPLALEWQPVKEKENSEFKPAILGWKNDLVPHPAQGGGVG